MNIQEHQELNSDRISSDIDNVRANGAIVFIDPSVDDYSSLMAGVVPGVEAVLLDSMRDGVTQITERLRSCPDIASIHIVSHGSPGCLYLGNSQLSLDTLDGYASDLQTWLSPSLLLYGCNVAAGDAGAEFIEKLHRLTGAEIAASANRTGSVALGGDWELEISTGQLDISLAFRKEVKETYTSVFTTLTVDTLVDENDGNLSPGDVSLREAIAYVSSGGSIDFDPSLSGGTITLTEGRLNIDKSLTINGLGAENLIVSGDNASSVFLVDDGDENNRINVEINGLTIADGRLPSIFATGAGIRNDENLQLSDVIVRNNEGGSRGTGIGNLGFLKISESTIAENSNSFRGAVGGAGGIANFSGATLEIESSTIRDNSSAKNGGGIYNGGGILSITNSTISGNTIDAAATGLGGAGIRNTFDGTLIVRNSTITDNEIILNSDSNDASFVGGGISTGSGFVSVANTIVAGNTINRFGEVTPSDVFGSFASNGHNLIGNLEGSTGFNASEELDVPVDWVIEPTLADNGGSTQTHALVPNSPAIDAAAPNTSIATDQRGVFRPQGNGFDIGAFELTKKVGYSSGDPHLKTFDGLSYDLQSAGEFVLVESNSDSWEIQVRQQPRLNSDLVSVNTAVATYVEGNYVGFYVGRDNPLEINGKETPLGDGNSLPVGPGKNSRIIRDGNTFILLYAGDDGVVTADDDVLVTTLFGDHMNVSVVLDPDREGLVQGLLGNADMDSSNDLALRDGTILAPPNRLYPDYADSWRISQDESLFHYEPGEDTNTFTDPDFPKDLAEVTVANLNQFDIPDLEQKLMDAEEMARNAGIPEGPAFDAAVLDFVISGDETFIDAAVEVINGPMLPPLFGNGVFPTPNNDYLVGGLGNDSIDALAGDDTVDGGFGDDLLRGNRDNDLLLGGGDNDTLEGGDGEDTLDGGNGTDTASYENDPIFDEDRQLGVSVDLSLIGSPDGSALDGWGNRDRLVSIENVIGSNHNDQISGDAENNYFQGGNGRDGLIGEEGDDTLEGGNGKDSLYGGEGNDILNGGEEEDNVVYLASPNGVRVNLAQGSAQDGTGGTDQIIDIENVFGSRFADLITGNDGPNLLDGGFGNDILNGGNGNDTLEGSDGKDSLSGGSGIDFLKGGDDDDLLRGGSGFDILEGQNGNDNLVGGSGIDSLLGGEGNDRLWGEAGSDILNGGSGNDFLRGWRGNDTLTGGEGRDIFVIESGNDGLDNGLDTFKDFNILEDAITFRGNTRIDSTTLELSISESQAQFPLSPTFGKTILFGNGTPIAILENVPSTTDARTIYTLPENTWKAANDFLGIE